MFNLKAKLAETRESFVSPLKSLFGRAGSLSPEDEDTYGIGSSNSVVLRAGKRWELVERPTEGAIFEGLAHLAEPRNENAGCRYRRRERNAPLEGARRTAGARRSSTPPSSARAAERCPRGCSGTLRSRVERNARAA